MCLNQFPEKEMAWHFLLISSLFNQVESFFPPSVINCKGVTGIVSNDLSCAFKKLVTGKIFTLSIDEDLCATALRFSPEWQALKNKKQASRRNKNNFCICKITN